MSTATLTPTAISNAFWAMSNHFKELLGNGSLTPLTRGVCTWEVQMLPSHEIVTFETNADGLISAAWTTVNPVTRDEDFNEVTLQPSAFDLMFAKDVMAAIPA